MTDSLTKQQKIEHIKKTLSECEPKDKTYYLWVHPGWGFDYERIYTKNSREVCVGHRLDLPGTCIQWGVRGKLSFKRPATVTP
jgi:hypothetical protein